MARAFTPQQRTVCSERPDCLPCCDAHLQWLQDARERQNPWSTYGD
jgi:hypothetical protein